MAAPRERKGPKTYVDVDTSDAFLDYPDMVYSDGSKVTWERVQEVLDERRAQGRKLPRLSPPRDDS